jgi:deoxyribonuclease V
LAPEKIRLVGGIDVAYAGNVAVGAVTACDFGSMKLEEYQTSTCLIRFPYLPTLLSFREIRPVMQSIRKLDAQPDVFLVNGHGYAHPNRCGFASHLGLIIGRPTIGVAKNILVGEVAYEGRRGSVAYISHLGKIVGAEVRVSHEHKPVYVSVGHLASLNTAMTIVEKSMRNHRLPEPISIAHEIARKQIESINSICSTEETSE